MTKVFDITLTARDKFSAVFKRLNKTAGTTAKATTASGKAAEDAGKSTEKWARGMERVTRAATSSVSALRDAAEPMSALGSMRFAGPAGAALALAASVGVLTQKWAESTAEVGRTSKAFGVDATDLQLWSAAAKGAGFSADEMAESYTRLAKILYLARNAPNEVQGAVGLINKYQIDPRDPAVAMRQITKILQGMPNGLLRSRFGEDMGQNESSVRYMMRGVEKVTDEIEKLRQTSQAQSKDAVDQAEAQVGALGRLENAWTRLKNTVGAAASPVMVKIMDAMSGGGQKGGTLGDLMTGRMTRGAGPSAPSSEGWDYFMRGASIVGDTYKPAGAPSGPSTPQGPEEFKRQLQDDLKGGANFSSPALLDRLVGVKDALELEVTFANAPPDTTVRARSKGQQVPVRISNSAPMGSTP